MNPFRKLEALATPNVVLPARVQVAAPIAAPNVKVKRSIHEMVSRGSVQMSPDLARIMALPRRPPPNLDEVSDILTARLKMPGGTQRLRPHQAWALWEAPMAGGLVGSIAVGEGKTLIGLLMPMVMPSCRRAVLLIPPSLRPQLYNRDLAAYGKHWVLPNIAGGDRFFVNRPVLHVVAYSELSTKKGVQLLESITPDLILADECHLLAHHTSARVKRFLSYLVNHEQTRFCGWSGTVTSRSLRDYAHLAMVALFEGSPLPLDTPTVEEWAAALDPNNRGSFFDAGMLRRMGEPGEDPRSIFRRRFIDTLGVVATAANKLGTSLLFHERVAPPVPDEVTQALRQLRRSPKDGGWVRPDGEELVDGMRVAACARELAQGFFYRWRFPKGEPENVIDLWFSRRQDWNRELREKLQNSRPYLDSPDYCTFAAIRFYDGGCPGCERGPTEQHRRGCQETESHPLWQAMSFLPWRAVKDTVYHEQEAVWLSDFLLQDAVAWMAFQPGIVWAEHAEVGRRLGKLSGLPYYGGGERASAEIIEEKGNRAIIASSKAHNAGKNLQEAFSRNLIMCMPTDAKLVEQMIGRTHREGQPKDEVEVFIYRHTAEMVQAFDDAQEKARYIQQTMGTAQKLVYGSVSW